MTSSGDREKNLAEGKNSHTSGKQVMEKKTSTLKENQKKTTQKAKNRYPQNILFLFSTHSVTLITILDILYVKETAETKENEV